LLWLPSSVSLRCRTPWCAVDSSGRAAEQLQSREREREWKLEFHLRHTEYGATMAGTETPNVKSEAANTPIENSSENMRERNPAGGGGGSGGGGGGGGGRNNEAVISFSLSLDFAEFLTSQEIALRPVTPRRAGAITRRGVIYFRANYASSAPIPRARVRSRIAKFPARCRRRMAIVRIESSWRVSDAMRGLRAKIFPIRSPMWDKNRVRIYIVSTKNP